jgi:hypothetical protein
MKFSKNKISQGMMRRTEITIRLEIESSKSSPLRNPGKFTQPRNKNNNLNSKK